MLHIISAIHPYKTEIGNEKLWFPELTQQYLKTALL